MEEYDRDNYHTKRPSRPRSRGTSQQPPCHVFADDFDGGFSRVKPKVKAKSMVHRVVPPINASGAPPVPAISRHRSRPRYKGGTALHVSSAEDSDSADELNLCSSQSETQSRRQRAGSRTQQALSNSLEWKQSTPRNERGMMQSSARGARAFGKQKANRVAKVVPSTTSTEKEGRSSQDIPLDAPVTGVWGRTVSSSGMCLRGSRLQHANRAVAPSVASTSSSKDQLHQRPPLSNPHSLTTLGGHLSFTELVAPRRSPRTREESPLLLSDHSAMRDKILLHTSQKGKGTTVSSTNSSSCTQGSGSSKASTRSGRKQLESGVESSSRQWKEVPWADLVDFPSSAAPATPRTGTSKSSQNSSLFPMHLTPPDLRMKNQAILDELDNSATWRGNERSRKRRRSSMKEAPNLSDECVIVSESQCFF
jgi:hypothetical protein